MLYLACPYSHPDPAVRDKRHDAACKAAAALLRAGVPVYAPVVHSHNLVRHGLPTDWQFWSRFDPAFLEIADAVVVLALDGWQESIGVREEVRLAEQMSIPVLFARPDEIERLAERYQQKMSCR
jgi:hypothetical protein